MKKFILILISVITVSFMTSCESYEPMYYSKIPRQYANAAIMTEPVILEIDTVFPNIIYDTIVFEIPNMGSTPDTKNYFEGNSDHYIENAMLQMANKNNADEIINFKWDVAVLSHSSYAKLNLSYELVGEIYDTRALVIYCSGYAIKYKAMRKATKEDLWMSKFNK